VPLWEDLLVREDLLLQVWARHNCHIQGKPHKPSCRVCASPRQLSTSYNSIPSQVMMHTCCTRHSLHSSLGVPCMQTLVQLWWIRVELWIRVPLWMWADLWALPWEELLVAWVVHCNCHIQSKPH
jgi:hypothetical protein